MSAWATTWAYEQDVKPCGKKAVLVALAHFADAEGFCYPGQETLADMTSQGVSTVRAHLESLEKRGVLKRGHRYKKGKRTSDGYYLQAPIERLQPQRNYRQKSAVVQSELPPEKPATTAEKPVSLPPRSGGDLLDDLSVNDQVNTSARARGQGNPAPKEPHPFEELFTGMVEFLEERIGPVRSTRAEFNSLEWLNKNGYDPEECERCLDYLLSEPFRTVAVNWGTVAKEIGNWRRLGSPEKFVKKEPSNGRFETASERNVRNIRESLNYLDSGGIPEDGGEDSFESETLLLPSGTEHGP